MKRTNIFFPLVTFIALTIISCQKDNPMTPQTNDSQTATNLQNVGTPEARLVLNPTSIPSLNHKLPAFDYEHFKASYRPIDIFEKFTIEEEDLPYLVDDLEQELTGGRSTVVLEAGSVDGLADAIDEAGEDGKVIVEAGTHYESGRVLIELDEVKIIGQPGAVIESGASDFMPALHIKNAEEVKIQGLELVSTGTNGTFGIFIENSEEVKIKNNTLLGFDLSIANEKSEETKITQNTIMGTGNNDCIVNINGEEVKILGNDLSNGFFGAWLCDEDGKYKYNTTHGNVIGVILCKVPAGSFPLPDGGFTGAEKSGTDWTVKYNSSNNNIWEGYLAIDGANNNSIKHNSASGNGTYAIELAGDSYRFGFLTPTSFENNVKAGNENDDITIKDCGEDNSVNGGDQVDTDLDPCS